MKNVLVTGGAGYVGSKLIPRLLSEGYKVRVLDWFLYKPDVFNNYIGNNSLELVKGDLRDKEIVNQCVKGMDSVIHLGCLSNDPSCEIDENITKSINLDAGIQLVDIAKKNNVSRFINASSASVYGVKEEENVTELSTLEPITLYAKYKAKLEEFLHKQATENFSPVTLRPATVCGYAPRLRLDLTVNILTYHALSRRKITVFGGQQKRPNININDLVDIYILLLKAPKEKIHNEVFNAGFENYKVIEIAHLVKNTLNNPDIEIEITKNNDFRSYHISSEKIINQLGYTPKYNLKDAILELSKAFSQGLVPEPESTIYRNVNFMKNKLEMSLHK